MTFSGGLRGLRPPAIFFATLQVAEVSQVCESPCEPWVMISYMLRAAKRRQEIKLVLINPRSQSPLRGSITLDGSYPRLTKPRLGLNSNRCSAAMKYAVLIFLFLMQI